MIAPAIACAALITGAALLLIGWPRADLLRKSPRTAEAPHKRLIWALLGVAGLAVVMIVAGGVLAPFAAFILVGAELITTAAWLVQRGRAERRGLANERTVIRACSLIAGLLDAGEIPTQALLTTADDVPLLAPAAGAVSIGGDVPTELQNLSLQPGCSGLAWLARGWRLSESTGMPLSSVARYITDTLRRQGDVRDQRRAELSTAKATSRLLAGLPVVGIGMGFLVGANPLTFLTDGLVGHLCLIGASTLICIGLIWTTQLSRENP